MCGHTRVCRTHIVFCVCVCSRVRVYVCVRPLRFSRYKKTSGLCTQKTSGLCSIPESLLGSKSCEPGRGPRQAHARRGTPPGPRGPRGREPRRSVFVGGGFFFFPRPDIKPRTRPSWNTRPARRARHGQFVRSMFTAVLGQPFFHVIYLFFTNFSLAFYFLCSFFFLIGGIASQIVKLSNH